MNDYLQFPSRQEFRAWLESNCMVSGGVWLLFGKPGGPKTIKADEALEEALCFGWIDGQIQSIDEKSYLKYFAQRLKNSRWSDKNKKLAEKLENQELMTVHGRDKIVEARKNGQWDTPNPLIVTDEHIRNLSDLLKKHEPAWTNFQAMSFSIKKTYTRAYLDAKTDAGRDRSLSRIIERLNQNLKPM